MHFTTWNLLFTGMVSSILLLNLVQWNIYRERIYGFYALYMLAWLVYFSLRVDGLSASLSTNAQNFVRATVPMLAYVVYFSFIDSLLQLRRTIPRLLWLFDWTRLLILGYVVLIGVVCFAYWNEPLYTLAHALIRLIIIGLATYAIPQISRLKGVVPRYLALGSGLLLAGAVASMIMSTGQVYKINANSFLFAPLTYLEFGIIGELTCFTLLLGYSQRQGAIKSAIVEQELARERERHQREQIEAELVAEKLQQQISAVQIKALRSQMNPHFFYNSLNAIRLFVLQNDSDNADKFLVKFSRLMRLILENSRQEWVTLASELEQLQLYLELEQLRFSNKFDFSIRTDPALFQDAVSIPPMIIQPYIENAILHGIAYKKSRGNITVYIQPNKHGLDCSVEDDGVGRQKAAELKSKTVSSHTSVGLKVTEERLQLIHQQTGQPSQVVIIDKVDAEQKPTGTKVEIHLPVLSARSETE
ncbi:histidine kinase [Larkinella punicea]|uniref:Sensor protein lytS n=1 Tax=Larkinella punicea TaxID=2315727 RepID=A0A368JKH7_9BACT|nr:histidine kinase [Larkinella punicea]RCR68032.1 sensor protein lytS [Larkinella punicea]